MQRAPTFGAANECAILSGCRGEAVPRFPILQPEMISGEKRPLSVSDCMFHNCNYIYIYTYENIIYMYIRTVASQLQAGQKNVGNKTEKQIDRSRRHGTSQYME